ncbi:MAG TPA: alpha/beta hydrolase [Fimbriimonadaceae bacterium]|nr:alpha/beta hydrolase [Fimbriimonadaceae bacterium]
MMLASILLLIAPKIDLDVVYAKVGTDELKMDVYYPEKPLRKPTPAVLVIHGGAWVSGKRQDVAITAKALADRGFIAASVSYRLAPKSKWPAMLDDCQTAVRYLRANSAKMGIDKARLGAIGYSAGGHLSLFLGARETRDPKPAEFGAESSRVQAVANFFGPTDLTLESDYPKNLDPVFQMVLGKPRAQAATEIKDASPLYFVTKSTAPTFIYQGLADPLVNPNQSRILEKKFKEVGVVYSATYLEGVGHDVPVSNKAAVDAHQKAVEWLVTHLK